MLIYLAALQSIPEVYYDAAHVDGASRAQQFHFITWPLLGPATFLLLILNVIYSFHVFDLVFVMTGGGPNNASEVLGTYAYSSAFELNRISYGTALALAISVMAIPFAVGLNRLQRRLSLEGGAA